MMVWLHPLRSHSYFSATALFVLTVALSRVLGLARESFVAWKFGASPETDAFVAAFTLADFVNYLMAGGTASITFVAMLTRYSAENRDEEAESAFSVILTVVPTVMILLVGAAIAFAPEFTRWWFPDFSREKALLCVRLTRILLPIQAFFVVGGVLSAVLQWKRQFLLPSLQPIIYNLGIILGGILLSDSLGISSLAWGAFGGAFMGAFLINAVAVGQSAFRYRPSFAILNPGFQEWLRLSIPLMLGVSVVFLDEPFIRHFAGGIEGEITRLNYAKRLFFVPVALVGQAVGQASLPFFSELFGRRDMHGFGKQVSDSVVRASSIALLIGTWLMVSSLPIVEVTLRSLRGQFQLSDSLHTAHFLLLFAPSLLFWCAQALYSRAFYAAGDTFTPMVLGTCVAFGLYPLYWIMFQVGGSPGLVVASDLAIAMHIGALALLLHHKRLVMLSSMKWIELAKAAFAALLAGTVAYCTRESLHMIESPLALLIIVTVAFFSVATLTLALVKSDLLRNRAVDLLQSLMRR